MSLKIRLTRGGAKKRPYYRIVVANSRSPRDGKYLEQIGTYNPLLAKGAQPTDRVLRFLDAAGIAKRPARNNPNKAVPGEKAKERAEKKAEKAAAPAAEEAAEA